MTAYFIIYRSLDYFLFLLLFMWCTIKFINLYYIYNIYMTLFRLKLANTKITNIAWKSFSYRYIKMEDLTMVKLAKRILTAITDNYNPIHTHHYLTRRDRESLLVSVN